MVESQNDLSLVCSPTVFLERLSKLQGIQSTAIYISWELQTRSTVHVHPTITFDYFLLKQCLSYRLDKFCVLVFYFHIKKGDISFPKAFMALSVIVFTHAFFVMKVTEHNIAPLYMKRNAVLVRFDKRIITHKLLSVNGVPQQTRR